MRNDILELREVIKKLIPMLTKRNLQVTQNGSEAYVIADSITNEPKVVNIPAINDDATAEFISAIQGFLDHEVAHVLFTDFSINEDPRSPGRKASKRFHNMHNIVEDTMIERLIAEMFPGSGKNLHNVRNFYLTKVITPTLRMADEKKKFSFLLVVLLRALAGHEEMQEYMDKGNYWKEPLVEKFVKMLKPETLALLKTCKTTAETAHITADVLDILDKSIDPKSTSNPRHKNESKDKSAETEKSSEKSADDLDADKEGAEEDSEGESEEKSKEGSEEKSKKESEEGIKESSKEDSKEDSKKESEEESEEDADEDNGKTGESDSDEKSSDKKDKDGEKPNSSDGADDDAGDDIDGGVDGDGLSSSSSFRIEGGEYNKTGDLADEKEQKGSRDNGVGGAQSQDSIFDVPDEALEGVDMSAQIAIKISDHSRKIINASDYTVFSRDYDRIEPLETPETIDSSWISNMQSETTKMVGVMQKTLERALASQAFVANTPGFKRGRLHAPSFYRLLFDDPRIFVQRTEAKSKNTAVTLLIDNSGSMHGSKMRLAMLSAYALSETLEKVKIRHEVIGFTTTAYYDVPETMRKALIKQAEMAKVRFDRTCPIVMPIYKGFDERINATVRKRIAYAMNAQIGLAENIDGESLLYAVDRISRQPEKRKVVIVLSDGQPAGCNNVAPHLRAVTKRIEATNIELIGIGIKDRSVENYYKNHMVINDIDELPGCVMSELRRILMS